MRRSFGLVRRDLQLNRAGPGQRLVLAQGNGPALAEGAPERATHVGGASLVLGEEVADARLGDALQNGDGIVRGDACGAQRARHLFGTPLRVVITLMVAQDDVRRDTARQPGRGRDRPWMRDGIGRHLIRRGRSG